MCVRARASACERGGGGGGGVRAFLVALLIADLCVPLCVPLQHSRVLPCVTIFGDHIDIEATPGCLDTAEEAGFYASPDGSFSSGPAAVIVDRRSELEKWPRTELVLRSGKEAVRAVVTFDFATGALVKPVRVTKERWSCVWCDGADMEGSSGYIQGWADGEQMDAAALGGDWTAGGAAPERRKQIYMPGGVDVGVLKPAGGGCIVHVGWLVEAGRRVVLTRTYAADGTVAASQRIVECKQ
jgi:hypothetical protein